MLICVKVTLSEGWNQFKPVIIGQGPAYVQLGPDRV